MMKLQSLSELGTVKELVVPENAFRPQTTLEVPEGAFNTGPKRGEYPCYVKYVHHPHYKVGYASFVFIKSFLTKTFKKLEKGERFELVQGAAPHKHWFMLRKAALTRGNKIANHGVIFHTTDYINPDKLDKLTKYPMEHVVKDGIVYIKLPPELVPLVR